MELSVEALRALRQWLAQYQIDLLIFISIIISFILIVSGLAQEWVSDLSGDDGERGGTLKRGILTSVGIGFSGAMLWKWLTQHRINWLIFIFIIIFVVSIFSDPVPEWINYLLGNNDEQGGTLKQETFKQETFKQETFKRGALTFIGLGIGGLVFWKRVISAEQQAEAMREENKLTKDGHTQERLKNSIDHLGNKEASVRIGAAYELYHLAKDREEYRETVCDILCGHIRQKTREREDCKENQKNRDRLSEEIKIFLKLLCGEEGPFRECQIDLSYSFLQEESLKGAQLQGANLKGAHLQKVNLYTADLREANLWMAQLQGANLKGADLERADLKRAQLQGASLEGAQLQGAWLSEAQLQGAGLQWTKLQRADLQQAQLQGAGLWMAQLQGANLSEAKLQGVSSSEEHSKLSFQKRILDRVGKESDFTNVVFSGGLDASEVKEIIASMPAGMEDEIKKEMKKKLNEHVGKEAVRKLPDNSGAITGTYNKDKAEEWITDYEKSTNHQSAKDE